MSVKHHYYISNGPLMNMYRPYTNLHFQLSFSEEPISSRLYGVRMAAVALATTNDSDKHVQPKHILFC